MKWDFMNNLTLMAFGRVWKKMTAVAEDRVVDEIPDSMKKLASFIVRGFYSREHGRYSCISSHGYKVARSFTKFSIRPKLYENSKIA